MIQKIKDWLFKGVLLKKVLGKFVKHLTGFIVGFLATPKVAAIIDSLGISVDSAQMELGILAILIGLYGSGWNYIKHRFVKKKD